MDLPMQRGRPRRTGAGRRRLPLLRSGEDGDHGADEDEQLRAVEELLHLVTSFRAVGANGRTRLDHHFLGAPSATAAERRVANQIPVRSKVAFKESPPRCLFVRVVDEQCFGRSLARVAQREHNHAAISLRSDTRRRVP